MFKHEIEEQQNKKVEKQALKDAKKQEKEVENDEVDDFAAMQLEI